MSSRKTKTNLSKPSLKIVFIIRWEVDPAVRGCLKGISQDYRDLFPDKLPYGPPPKRLVDHEIETVPGETPPHKSPYRLSSSEMEELRRQVETLLEQG